MNSFHQFRFVLLSLCLLASLVVGHAQERAGKIEYSNSNLVSGVLSLSPGAELKIQAGSSVRVLAFSRVREIEFTPEKEEMERAWRFKEAGQTAKDFYGEPYPVRHLATTVTLADGEKITGHLYTTVLYVTDGDQVQKVILLAKQRGKERESYAMLVYPRRISFGDAEAVTADIKLQLSGLGPKPEVVAITYTMERMEAHRAGTSDDWTMASPLGKPFVLATRSSGNIKVGWPSDTDEKFTTLIRNAMTNSEDFFDERQTLGAIDDPTNSAIYSLVLGTRHGKTTLDAARSQPWRLEIYRWKRDDEGNVMLAGKNYFFRGIGGKNDLPPKVELSQKLWKLHPSGGVWQEGDE